MQHAAETQRATPSPEVATRPAPPRGAGGTSADLRTMDYDQGAACLAPPEEQAPAEVSKPLGRDEFFALLEATRLTDNALGHIGAARGLAATQLAGEASERDPAPWWQDAAIAAGTVALASATAGVGGVLLAGAVSAMERRGLTSSLAAVLVGGLKDATTGFLGSAIQNASVAELGPSSTTARKFFHIQSTAIATATMQLQSSFIRVSSAIMEASPDPVAYADAFAEAVGDVSLDAAFSMQRNASLDAWCTYQAKAALDPEGGRAEGPTNARAALDAAKPDGVLELGVTLRGDGTTSRIQEARIEGLNATLRAYLVGRPIGALGLPVVIRAEAERPRAQPAYTANYAARADDPTFRSVKVARDESGSVVVGTARGPAMIWLAQRGGDVSPSADHAGEPSAASVLRGASALVHQDIEPQTLSGEVLK